MPELPEVETIRRGLEPHLVGMTVRSLIVTDQKVLDRSAQRGKLSSLEGQRIDTVTRRGKYLVLGFERHYLIFHLGMTGQLTLRDPRRADAASFERTVTGLEWCEQHSPDRHTHVHILFEDGRQLLFRDVRKFGRVYVLKRTSKRASKELPAFFEIHHLGLEPFTSDYNLKAFLARFRNRTLRVKSLLLNQAFVAGIGNIYADEALFEAGLHPARKASSLRTGEKERLFHAIQTVLERGIEFGGTSFRDFVDSNGERGKNQEELYVYGREGEPCLRCGSAIVRTVISQRGTHFCPSCQPQAT
ncbi:MAG: bifunctional DNA-formamidopyrimidine glycosylase/DNA-(apurinic or apyrimidinic site) lyase [Acidobacteriota bacterium]